MIRIEIPFLPPSTNNAYLQTMRGPKMLLPKGRSYKNKAKTIIARTCREQLIGHKSNKPYLVLVRLFFERVENKGWPNKSKNRYKTFDATNRIKLLEDALVEGTGVDDSNNMVFIVSKEVGTPERSDIFIWSLEEEECGIYDLIKRTE